MEAALVHCSVAHESEGTALESLVFQTISQASPQRRLTGDNSVPTPVAFIRREIMH